MMLKKITLDIQSTPTATAQHYIGPQIVELLSVNVVGSKPVMWVIVDETKTQECDQYVQKVDQSFDKSCRSPNDEPIDQSNKPKRISDVLNTPKGSVVVSSYCFA